MFDEKFLDALAGNRRYTGVELHEEYVDVIRQRLGADEQLIAEPSCACVIAVCGAPMNTRSEQEYERFREEILACGQRDSGVGV